jgi:SWI/SNF-related matrix-associated actin-dependent regulator of chromatin subfamily A3
VGFYGFVHSLIDLFSRLSYVRFDGQMSAKRRQETLASFSVPVEDDEPIQSSQNTTTSRKKRVTRQASLDNDDFPFDNDDDDDFVMDDVANDDDDEGNDFSSVGKKGKGKLKTIVGNNTIRSSGLGRGNPRVMLISLKAVCSIYVASPPLLTLTDYDFVRFRVHLV